MFRVESWGFKSLSNFPYNEIQDIPTQKSEYENQTHGADLTFIIFENNSFKIQREKKHRHYDQSEKKFLSMGVGINKLPSVWSQPVTVAVTNPRDLSLNNQSTYEANMITLNSNHIGIHFL